jgi:hypothetical protein
MKNTLAYVVAALLTTGAPLAAQDQVSIAGDRVAIYNLAGEVRIEAGDGANVMVTVTRGGRDAHQLEVEQSQEAGWQQMINGLRHARGTVLGIVLNRAGAKALRQVRPRLLRQQHVLPQG